MYRRMSDRPTACRLHNTIGFTLTVTLVATMAACSAPSGESDKVPPAAMGMSEGRLSEPNVAEIRSTIEAANQRATVGMLAGDLAPLLANYADSVVVMMPGMPAMRGNAAVEQGMTGMMSEMKVTAATFTTNNVMATGDMAIESGSFTMTLLPKGGKPMDDKGKYLTVWQRQADGSWKILRDITNTDLPPTAPK